jgi:pyridinium-3,5-biscarboxylic acid mononucleotide sulfurtransferase
MLNKKTEKKLNCLKKTFMLMGSAVVAFSGGIDSTLLLKTAHDVLKKNVLAVIVSSVFLTKQELDLAIRLRV